MKFSQRIGKTPIKSVLQVESMDDDLRNRVWNVILEDFFDKISDAAPRYGGGESSKGEASIIIWKEFFKKPIDKIPTSSYSDRVSAISFVATVRDWFFRAAWFEIYDLIEFLCSISRVLHLDFETQCNKGLQDEVSAYRIVNNKIVQVTAEEEVVAIEEAAKGTETWSSVNTHLSKALELLADRKNPDYRNSIKESISAVESFCKIITGDQSATLGKALTEIEKKYSLHGALKTAFSAIYGYTSDAGGIRHALLEDSVSIDFEDAKFMLVACSAFINYLRIKMKL